MAYMRVQEKRVHACTTEEYCLKIDEYNQPPKAGLSSPALGGWNTTPCPCFYHLDQIHMNTTLLQTNMKYNYYNKYN